MTLTCGPLRVGDGMPEAEYLRDRSDPHPLTIYIVVHDDKMHHSKTPTKGRHRVVLPPTPHPPPASLAPSSSSHKA